MQQQRRNEGARLGDAAASARNAKPVVTRPAAEPLSPMDAHWQAIARKLFEEGHEERDVMEALRRQNCRGYMAADAVKATRRYYRNVHHMQHRKEGLKALVAGAVMCSCGAALLLLGMGSLVLYSGGLFLSGLVPLIFGLYKALTGSTVAIYLPEDQR